MTVKTTPTPHLFKISECTNSLSHTPCPSGYIERSYWFNKMAKTHKQTKCSACGLWAIWVNLEKPE